MTTQIKPAEGIRGPLVMRPFSGDLERQMTDRKQTDGWGRIRPDSVLVTAMGSHWVPGAWAKVADMLTHTNRCGVYCGLNEMLDRCKEPYDAIGTMRNEAIMVASNEGWEWLLYIDNDVFPEPDYLIRLLSHQLPIVAPFVAEPGSGKPLHGPPLEPGTGLKLAKWCVWSMVLFRVAVFNAWAPGTFWSDAIGADEGLHFQKLWGVGHRLFIDTNTQLQVGRRPLYPLAYKKLSWQERHDHEEKLRARMNIMPDRRPIDPESPYVRDGVYMPFAFPPEPKQEPVAPAK